MIWTTFPVTKNSKNSTIFLTSRIWFSKVIGDTLQVTGIEHIFSWPWDQPDAGNVFNKVIGNSDRRPKTFASSLNVLIQYLCFHNCANTSSKILTRLQLRSAAHTACLFAPLEITECRCSSHKCLMNDSILARLTLPLYHVKSFLISCLSTIYFFWTEAAMQAFSKLIPFYPNLFRNKTGFSISRESAEENTHWMYRETLVSSLFQ